MTLIDRDEAVRIIEVLAKECRGSFSSIWLIRTQLYKVAAALRALPIMPIGIDNLEEEIYYWLKINKPTDHNQTCECAGLKICRTCTASKLFEQVRDVLAPTPPQEEQT